MKTLNKIEIMRYNFILYRLTSKVLIVFALAFFLSGCSDYLDIVPDNIATIDNAFSSRIEAEKYLFTCYSYIPADGDLASNVAILGGDECWIQQNRATNTVAKDCSDVGFGYQNVEDPLLNFWDGDNSGEALFKALRSCNIFLENIENFDNAPDLPLDERMRWIGEVEVLKAYYHYILLRMYGPIPIIDENLPVSASQDAVKVLRMPVDSCVNYIAALLDTAAIKLPNTIQKAITDAGRITRPIALSIKAKLLLMAASPLYNGNSDYANFTDKHGTHLFNPNYDDQKWQKAADAAKKAIVASEEVGFKLYYFTKSPFRLSDSIQTQMNIRNAMCEEWNSEVIWGNSNSLVNLLQRFTMGNVYPNFGQSSENYLQGKVFAPLKMARLFYTKNGVPITEDKTLDFNVESELRTATYDERYYISSGYETARLNFDREPRFYANLGFDGGIWYMYDSPSSSDDNTYVLKAKRGQIGNTSAYDTYNASGYFIKKWASWESAFFPLLVYKEYPWPEIRLSDLYLMYAEALNEASGPTDEVFQYLDLIRERSGLLSVKGSWSNYSKYPQKYMTKDGMREIIHQERLIELAFEGTRFWDLRRWKKANEILNQPITGWSVKEKEASSYYRESRIYQPTFVIPRDYFWPIKEYNLTTNPELVQNPGW